MDGADDFVANVVGALALAVADRMNAQTAEAVRHGPTAPAVLTTLRFTPGLSIERLAQTVGITVPGAVQLLNRLEAAGLVERGMDSDDRRRRHPKLTASGRRLAERVLAVRRDVLDDSLNALSAVDRRRMGEASERILHQLSGTRESADRICRLCDERACPDERCPSEQALPAALRMGTLSP